MIHEVDATSGYTALRIRSGMIARQLPQHGKFLVFETVEEAIDHPTSRFQKD